MYIALLKIFINRALRLKVLLEDLEAFRVEGISLSTVGSSEYMVRARTPGPKQREYLYRLQQSIILPQCLLIGLKLIQTLLSLLNITFGLIRKLKILLLSFGCCLNSNLSILIILMIMVRQSSPLILIHIILLSYLVSSLQIIL